MSTNNHPTSFDSVLDLARLPWFRVQGGNRLVLAEGAADEIGPVVDSHTHLAMGFLRRLGIDLHRETPATAYYLPLTLPVDLELYSNQNLDTAAMFAMKADVSVLGLTAQGMRNTHTAPNLLRDMDALGIVRSVVLPFDLPLGARNADAVLEATERYPELVPFGSVHLRPRHRAAPRCAALSRGQGDQAAPQRRSSPTILKHGIFPVAAAGPVACRCCSTAGQLGSNPRPHVAAAVLAPRTAREVEHLETTTFVLGHSGALQHDTAIGFAERYENTYFELSCLGLGVLREVIEAVPSDRLLYGTDWPFYHQALTLARVLIATEGDAELRRAILHDNAVALFGLDH